MYNYAEDIKSKISMRDMCDKYGLTVNRAGFAVCPFHSEKTASMKIYNNGFYCFGCNAHGSVIDFEMKYNGVQYGTAINRLNCEFQLGLPIGKVISYRDKKRLIDANRARKQQLEKAQQEQQKFDDEYERLHAQWQILDTASKLRPKSPDEKLNVFFVEALQRKEYLEYLLDCMEDERRRKRE